MNGVQRRSVSVVTSLLLHAGILMLVANRLPNPNLDNSHVQTLTIELHGSLPAVTNRTRNQTSKSIATESYTEKLLVAATPNLHFTQAEQPQFTLTPNEQNSKQDVDPAKESSQTGINIQQLNKLTRLPTFLQKIEPVYPNTEQNAGKQAYVIAEVTIDQQGNVLDLKIIKSDGNAFDKAVIVAIEKSIFTPGYIGKEAVAVRVLIPFRFNLQ